MHQNEYRKLDQVESRMWFFRSLHRHVHRLLYDSLKSRENPEVLDAGCGTGGLIERLQRWEPSWRFTGIDVSDLASSLAAQRCSTAQIRTGSITSLPFPDQRFDAVISADVVSHVEEPARALAEFHRCLRPGGVVVINVAAYMWLWSYHDEACQTKHRYNRRELVDMLRAAGFTPQLSTHWNTLPFPLLVIKRKLFRTRSDTSDVRLYPAPLETLFNAAMSIEHAWLRHVSPLPFGSSVLVAAQKSAKP